MDATDVNIIRHMGIACWITNVLDTLKICKFTAFPRKELFRERTALLLLYLLLINPRAISEKYTSHLSRNISKS